ncbi:MAG: GNAT family N-acetyltransferase [Lachnospiraceae bacterium]|nr:GNAT family N-acetyltransferase [Lachnospiraceae bacterium]
MRIQEERLHLRDGRELLMRSVDELDAEAMLEYIRRTAEETYFLICYPEEVRLDLEEEKEILRKSLESDKTVWFTVFDGDKVVGNCSISGISDKIKYRHRCGLGIAILQEYVGQGLGTMLLERAIDKAKELGFEQLELGVFEDNANAFSLYKKLGFKEYGRTPRAFKLKDGTYRDEINMICNLSNI